MANVSDPVCKYSAGGSKNDRRGVLIEIGRVFLPIASFAVKGFFAIAFIDKPFGKLLLYLQ